MPSLRYQQLSWRVLCFINLAYVYAGGLFVYMGSFAISSHLPQLFVSTPMAPSLKVFVGAGIGIGVGGVAGNFLVVNRNDKKLKKHFWLLVALAGTFMVTTILSLVLLLVAHSNFLWNNSILPQLNENYALEMCRDVLRNKCHVRPNYYPGYDMIHQNRTYEWETAYVHVMSIANDYSIPFAYLCANVTDRMKLLPPLYAFNLNSSCQMCASLSPEPKVPEIDGFPGLDNDITSCRNRIFNGKFPIATSLDKDEFTFNKEIEFKMMARLKIYWINFSTSMAIASAGFSLIIAFQFYEVHRSLQEWRIAVLS